MVSNCVVITKSLEDTDTMNYSLANTRVIADTGTVSYAVAITGTFADINRVSNYVVITRTITCGRFNLHPHSMTTRG